MACALLFPPCADPTSGGGPVGAYERAYIASVVLIDEQTPLILLQLHQSPSFLLQFGHPFGRNCHCVGDDIVTVHRALDWEYELTIYDLVASEFAGQKRHVSLVRAIEIGTGYQQLRSQASDLRMPLIDGCQKLCYGIF